MHQPQPCGRARAAGRPVQHLNHVPRARHASYPPFQALPRDYLSGVSDRVGVPLQKLLLDNLDTLRDLDSPLAGKKLAVCPQGVSPPA
jgi:hypothetical protein